MSALSKVLALSLVLFIVIVTTSNGETCSEAFGERERSELIELRVSKNVIQEMRSIAQESDRNIKSQIDDLRQETKGLINDLRQDTDNLRDSIKELRDSNIQMTYLAYGASAFASLFLSIPFFQDYLFKKRK